LQSPGRKPTSAATRAQADMSDVNGILQPGETVLYRGKLHWTGYGAAIYPAVVAR
jgi:hypothetical protein